MKHQRITALAKRVLELNPGRLSFTGIQYLISNPLEFSVLMAWLCCRTDWIKDGLNPLRNNTSPVRTGTDPQFRTFVAKMLTIENCWWDKNGLDRLLDDESFESTFLRFVETSPHLISYLSERLFKDGKEKNQFPQSATSFRYEILELIQRLSQDIVISDYHQNTRLNMFRILRAADLAPADRFTLQGIYDRKIETLGNGNDLLTACGMSVAHQAMDLPTHFWYGRRLFFLGTAIITNEGLMVLCMDNSDSRNDTPTPCWVKSFGSLYDTDAFLHFKKVPEAITV